MQAAKVVSDLLIKVVSDLLTKVVSDLLTIAHLGTWNLEPGTFFPEAFDLDSNRARGAVTLRFF